MKTCASAVFAAAATAAFVGYVVRSSSSSPIVSPIELQNHPNDHDEVAAIRVTCVGDSITIHACASNDTMPYPAQLGRMLGPRYAVSNLGDSGKTMLKGGLCAPPFPCAGDCSYWDQPTYQRALTSQPDIVTIMLGTNDAKECNWYGPPNGSPSGAGTEFVAAYLDMIANFRALPTQPRVYVVLPPPLAHPPQNTSLPPPYGMSNHTINVVYPALQRSVAWRGGADGVIDVWSALGGMDMDPKMTCDGCHPVDGALTVIARTIANVIAPPPPSPPTTKIKLQ